MSRWRPSASLLIGFAIALLASQYAGTRGYIFYDLNLHYFAGELQRHGIYTDTSALFSLMRDNGLPQPAEGVYGTPTLVALLFQPLSLLPLPAAHFVWVVTSCTAITLAVRKAAGNSRYWPLWLGIVVWAPAMVLGGRLGNVSVFTTSLLLYAYGSLRAGHQRRAGIALGVAAALKLFPGLLLLVLLFGRQKQAAVAMVATIAAMFVATLPALGISDTISTFHTTLRLGSNVHDGLDNVSLPAYVLHSTHNESLAKACSYVLVLAAIGLLWRMRRLPAHQLLAIGALTMLLVQTVAWRHYFGLAIVAPLALSHIELPRVRKGLIVLTYAMCTGFVMALIQQNNVVSDRVSGSYTIGAVILLFLLVKTLHEATPMAEENKGQLVASSDQRMSVVGSITRTT